MLNTLNKMIKRSWKLLIYRRKVFGTVGKDNTFDWSVYVNEDAKIGSNNYFGPYSMVNNAIIGNFCSIGPSVKIGQGMHSLEFYTTYQRLSKQIINHTLNTIPAIIGNDVWIGANAIVMQDVKIGNGAVIGANAVVTKDIPSYAIAVGVPAKVIKYRFTEEQIIKIQESGWDKMNFSDAKITLEQLYTNNRKKK